MLGKIEFVKAHDCTNNNAEIAVEQYKDCRGTKHWYWDFKGELHGIKYCPYCGKNLYS